MSLINKVLRDLEHRHATPGQASLMGLNVRALPATSSVFSGRNIAIVTLVAAGILGGLVANTQIPRFTHTVAPKALEPAKAAQAKPTPPVAAAPSTAGEVAAVDASVSASEAASTQINELRLDAELRSPAGGSSLPRYRPVEVAHLSPRERARPPASSAQPVLEAGASRKSHHDEPLPIEKNVRESSARERAYAALESGLEALGRNAHGEAQQFFLAAIAADPSFDRGRQALLSLLLGAQNKAMAEAVALDGVVNGEVKASFAMISARLKIERGAIMDALALLVQERAVGASNPDYLAMWGNVLSRSQRHAESAQKYSEAIALAPRNPAYYIGLGYALRNDGQYAAAQAVFQRVSEMEGIGTALSNLAQQQLQSLQRVLAAAPKK